MIRPELVPFKAEHAMTFVDYNDWTEANWSAAFDKEKNPAYTGMYGEEIIGCAGIIISTSMPGIGTAWLTISPIAALKFKIWMSRSCKRIMEDIARAYHLYRLEAVVIEDLETNLRWMRCLELTPEQEGRAANYLPDKRSVIRFERIFS